MSVGVEKLEGVASVRVSLEEGLVEVALEPGNALDPEEIRNVARDAGFTPKQAEVRVRGRLVRTGDGRALAVSALEREYRLVEHAAAPGRLASVAAFAAGTPITVSAILPESGETPDAQRILEVRELSIDP